MTKVVLGGIVHQTKQSDLTPRQLSILQRFEDSPYSVLVFVGDPAHSDFQYSELNELFELEMLGLLGAQDTVGGADYWITDAGRAALMAYKQAKITVKQEVLTPLDPSALQWLMRLRSGNITVSPSDIGLAALDALTRTPYASEIAGTNNLEEMGYRTFQITEAGIEYLQENGKMQKQGGLSPVQISLMQQIANYSIGSWQASANYSDLSYLLQMGFLTGAISAPDTLQLTKSGYDALEANDAGLDNNPYDAAAARQIAGKQQKGFMGLSPAAEALLQRMHHNFFEAGNYDYLIPVGFSPDEQAIYELTGRGWARFVEMDEDNQAKAYELTNEGIAAAEQSLGISKQQKQGGDSVDLILRASTALNGIICVDLNTPDQVAAEELVRWGTFTRYTSIPGNAEDLSDSAMCYQITPRALRNVTEGNFPGIKQQSSSLDELKAALEAKAEALTDDSPLPSTEKVRSGVEPTYDAFQLALISRGELYLDNDDDPDLLIVAQDNVNEGYAVDDGPNLQHDHHFRITPLGKRVYEDEMAMQRYERKSVTKVLLGGIVHEIPEKRKVMYNGQDITSADQLSWNDVLKIWISEQPADLYPMALDAVVRAVERFVQSDTTGLRNFIDNKPYSPNGDPTQMAELYDAQNGLTRDTGRDMRLYRF